MAQKDCILHHDMFISRTCPVRACIPEQQEAFVRVALDKVLEERKWASSKVDVDAQLDEASFVYRRVVEMLPSEVQGALCLLWTFLMFAMDRALFRQED